MTQLQSQFTSNICAKVLIVDDESANRRLLKDLVSHEGHQPILACDGVEALNIIATQEVDVVLLDLMMPQMSGIDVLNELSRQKKIPGLAVVIVTALEDRKIKVEALTAGAVDFISKPIDRLEVACKVRSLSELSQLRRQTANIASQAASEQLLNRFKRIVNNLPLYLYEYDKQDDGEYTNAWIAGDIKNITGLSKLECNSPEIFASYVHPHDQLEFKQSMAKIQSGELSQWNISYRWQHPVKGERYLIDIGQFDQVNQILLGAVFDVTLQKQLEEKLLQSHKMEAVGQLAAGIAHDFNNLISVIGSFATFAYDSVVDEQSKADIKEVLNAAKRAEGLTSQLLTFSSQQSVKTKVIDLNESLTQMNKILLSSVTENINLNMHLAPQPALVKVDPVQFDQVLLNLVVNARDAMPDGGTLNITLVVNTFVDDKPSTVELIVQDTGTGMDEQTQKNIFTPFFTTKDTNKGTGLGLAICYNVINEAGGTLSVMSELNKGSTFTAQLPYSINAIEHKNFSKSEQFDAHGHRVLVAEDDYSLRMGLVRILTNAGYQVDDVETGTEAIALLKTTGTQYSLVFCDVMMPGATGYEVADYVKQTFPHLPVLLTTGYTDGSVTPETRDDIELLWKPVSSSKLLNAVGTTIANNSHNAVQIVDEESSNDILIIEDEEIIQVAYRRILSKSQYKVSIVDGLVDAKDIISKGLKPMAILCDLNLGDGNAIEFFDWLEGINPLLAKKMTVITGGAIDREGVKFVNSGRCSVLKKPVKNEALIAHLNNMQGTNFISAPVDILSPDPVKVQENVPEILPARNFLGERILLVEDDVAVAKACSRMLSNAGFEPVVVNSLSSARKAINEQKYDGMITDLSLVDGNGLELLNELRATGQELPTVVITGGGTVESAIQAVRLNAYDYLIKPFRAKQLVSTIRAAVDTGRVEKLRAKLLASRFGGDEFTADVKATAELFERALPKIRVEFQPIVRSSDSSIYAFEALLRCDEPGLATPLRLLAAAEVLGRVIEVGYAVREFIAQTLKSHPDRVETIFVNLHPSELRADLLIEACEPLLNIASRVVLEVTERASLGNGTKLQDDLQLIREKGYRVAVDDLGEGYSGLNSLVSLLPDFVKIDMCLIQGVHKAPMKQDIIGAIVEMAKRSGIIVIAEGIECIEERDTLLGLGVDLFQGFLFSKPEKAFPEVMNPDR